MPHGGTHNSWGTDRPSSRGLQRTPPGAHPTEHNAAVPGLVRTVTPYPATTERAARLLQTIPAGELEPAALLALPAADPALPQSAGVLEDPCPGRPGGQPGAGSGDSGAR